MSQEQDRPTSAMEGKSESSISNRTIGLSGLGLGAAALLVFWLVQTYLYVRIIPLAVIGILAILAGIFMFFSKEDKDAESD